MRVVRGLWCESWQVRGRAPAYRSSSARPRPASLPGRCSRRISPECWACGGSLRTSWRSCDDAGTPDGPGPGSSCAADSPSARQMEATARGSPVSPSHGDSTSRAQTPTDCRYCVGEIGARASAGQSGASVAMKIRVGRYAYLWEGAEPLVPGDRVLLPENWLSRTIHGPGPLRGHRDRRRKRLRQADVAGHCQDRTGSGLETAGAGHNYPRRASPSSTKAGTSRRWPNTTARSTNDSRRAVARLPIR